MVFRSSGDPKRAPLFATKQGHTYTGVVVTGAAVHGDGGCVWHWSLMPCWTAPGPKEDGQHCRSPLLPLATVGQMDSGTTGKMLTDKLWGATA